MFPLPVLFIRHIPEALDSFKPDIIVYNAGKLCKHNIIINPFTPEGFTIDK